MRFTVKLTTPTGEVITRDFDGEDADDIRRRVMADGSYPLEIQRSGSAFHRVRQIKADTLVLFNQEFLALLKAGIPLLQSLELLVGHGKDPHLRESLERVVTLVREGVSYSDALEQVGSFPAVYRANVVAGERSGTLTEVIARWLSFQKFAQTSRRRIMEALFYPGFLVLVLIMSLAVLFNVVLPKFSEVYSGSGIEMPTATRVLLSIGKFMEATIWLQAGLVVVVIFLARWMVTTEAGRRLWERGLLALPKLGTLYRMYHSSIFSRTLSVLLNGGMPVLQALEVIQRTSASERMKLALITVQEQVRAGSSLHLALEHGKVLDPLAVEMCRVGEQASALPDMLNHVSDFFDQEVEKATTAVTSLIGPVLILFMGVTVLGMLMAIYVPLFNAGDVIK